MKTRLLASAAVLAGITAAGLTGSAGAQIADSFCAAPAGESLTFNYSDRQPKSGYLFRVPERVHTIHAIVEGAHGGENGSTGLGGAGGMVDVQMPVTPGDCLAAFVGEYGDRSGGDGWADGGDHGTIPGGDTNPGSSAAGGGGASAILRNGEPLIVAGGGGGGGGDGQEGSQDGGGTGGDGTSPPGNGGGGADAKDRSKGGKGGRGGGESGKHGGGGAGDDGTSNYHGAGGGGGGGMRGGRGGSLEHGDFFPASGGGGGGGGGSSAITFTPPDGSGQIFFQSTRPCEYKHEGETCNGQIHLSWRPDALPLSPALMPLQPALRVLPTDLTKATLPLSLSPVAPRTSQTGATTTTVPIKLRLLHRRGKKFKKVATETVIATSNGPTELELPLTKKTRRIMREAQHGRFRLIATDESTGQRIDDQRLRID
jgi:hypothetical protein